MNNIATFRSIVGEEKASKVFKELIAKQDAGEIRTEAELRQELQYRLREVKDRGKILLEIPILEWDIVESEKIRLFFEMLKDDIDVIFVDVDNTESILDGLEAVSRSQVQNLQFTLGELKAEAVKKQISLSPGLGFSSIARDSFDRGYGQLAGRAEVPYDLFQDIVETTEPGKAETIPIRADARVEGIGKKLTLPESDNQEIGFKNIEILSESDTTSNQLSINDRYELVNAIDGAGDTFWSITIGRNYPVLGTPLVTVDQVGGISGVKPLIDSSSLTDPRGADYYFKMVGMSGTLSTYMSLPAREGYIGPICYHDVGTKCRFNYDEQYSPNCANNECSRYSVDDVKTMTSGIVQLEDGFGNDTNVDLSFSGSISSITPGQTWRVNIEPSGTVGAVTKLELTLTRPSQINWFELDPVTGNPFVITGLDYISPNTSGRISLVDDEIAVKDKVRIDFPKVGVEKLILTLNQRSYEAGTLRIDPDTQALSDIEDLRTQNYNPTPQDTQGVGVLRLLDGYLQDQDARRLFVYEKEETAIPGYFYQLGIFDVNCGLAQYSETAIAVSKETRVKTPRLFGLQTNLDPKVTLTTSGTDVGTMEYSVVKMNYDDNGELINIQDFPMPLTSGQYITERLFLDSEKKGVLRFTAQSVSGISVLSTGRELATTEYSSTTSSNVVPQTTVAIDRLDIGPNSSLLITYKPSFGVYLDDSKNISIIENTLSEVSLSDIETLVSVADKAANRHISFSDVFLRIILRRNNNDSSTTPELRDYQLMIGEDDASRFLI